MIRDLISSKRLGKDEKLAKEAQIPFTVKVGGDGGVGGVKCEVLLLDPGQPPHGRVQ